MAAYVAGYDVEAVYAWWDSDHTEHTGDNYDDVVSYEGERLSECLAGVRAVAEVHLQRDAPATFFIVARLLEAARSELVEILDHPIFDIASHSFTHPDIKAYLHDDHRLRHEIVDSKAAIEDAFGREVVGFTTPGGYEDGYIGEPRVLEILKGAGYRYLRSVGCGPHYSMPAPLPPAVLVRRGGLRRSAGDPHPRLARQRADRPARPRVLAAGAAMGLSHEDADRCSGRV